MDRSTSTRAGRVTAPPVAVVVMGVAGSGKSVVGEALAKAIGAVFIEGDRLHPPENVAKMAGGVALDDEDRKSWLDAIGRQMAATVDEGQSVVAACSALKRSYRDHLRLFRRDIRFLYLAIDSAEAERRVAGRQGHFMPASLVDSQFAILEPPQPDEVALTVDGTLPVGDIVGSVRSLISDRQVASNT